MSQTQTVVQTALVAKSVAATKIIAIGDTFVTFERKKPHTSKVQVETVTVGGERSVLAVYGNVGDAGTVLIAAKEAVYHDTGAVEVNDKFVDVKGDYNTRFFVQPGAALEITSEAYGVEAEAAAE